jgi:hypothetical protein
MILILLAVGKSVGMSGYHQFLIRPHDPDAGRAVAAGNNGCIGIIAAGIQMDTQEFHVLADAPANRRRVFTDAPGKDQGVQPTQYGSKRTQVLPGLIAKEIDSFGGMGIFCLLAEQVFHVRGRTRYT